MLDPILSHITDISVYQLMFYAYNSLYISFTAYVLF